MPHHKTYSLSASLNLAQDGTTRQAALARALREAILSGALRYGERLPSTRSLAQELKLSRNTVVQALDRLNAEGLIEGRHGAGTFVAEELPAHARKTIVREASTRARSLMTKGFGEITQPLTPGVPALEAFPKKLWARLSAKWARSLSFSELDYGDPAGIAPLREAIAIYIGVTRGVVCKSEQVIITSGSQGAIASAAFLVADHGDPIAVENPGYVSARNTLAIAGLRLVPYPLDDQGIAMNGLAPDIRLALVAPSHQYPLGVTMSMERRMELLQWARMRNGWIIEDDYDGEYRYDSHPLPALASLDTDGAHVLYAGTLSKVLSPSIRLGFLVVPENLINDARRIRAAVDRGVPTIVQAISADFIGDGHLGLHIRKTQALYAERRERLVQCLEAIGIFPLGSPAGLHMTLPLDKSVDDMALARKMANLGLGGNPLSAYFYAGTAAFPGLVAGFANAGDGIPERLQTALRQATLRG